MCGIRKELELDLYQLDNAATGEPILALTVTVNQYKASTPK